MEKLVIVSMYPTPYDLASEHDSSVAIATLAECSAGQLEVSKLYAYEEGKLSTRVNDGLNKYPEQSLFCGLQQLNIQTHEVNRWIFPVPSPQYNLECLCYFFNKIKAGTEKIDAKRLNDMIK